VATVPTTRTAVTGEVTIAAHFNDYIRDPLNYLLAPPILECRQSVAQTVATGGVGAAITMTTEAVDSSGMHSTSVNTSRATGVYPGWYQFGGQVCWVANATGRRVSWWAVNAATMASSQTGQMTITGGSATEHNARTKHLFLNVSDYAELFGFQDSGGNLNTAVAVTQATSGMSARWVSN
jgi:hypothetical protein